MPLGEWHPRGSVQDSRRVNGTCFERWASRSAGQPFPAKHPGDGIGWRAYVMFSNHVLNELEGASQSGRRLPSRNPSLPHRWTRCRDVCHIAARGLFPSRRPLLPGRTEAELRMYSTGSLKSCSPLRTPQASAATGNRSGLNAGTGNRRDRPSRQQRSAGVTRTGGGGTGPDPARFRSAAARGPERQEDQCQPQRRNRTRVSGEGLRRSDPLGGMRAHRLDTRRRSPRDQRRGHAASRPGGVIRGCEIGPRLKY